MRHARIKTTAEVWAVIKASHGEKLVVFSSYSNPTGNDGMTSQPQMMTEFGFRASPIPLMGAETRWERGKDEYERVNVTHEYWLCIPRDEDEDNDIAIG
jgi:hypothetical protein